MKQNIEIKHLNTNLTDTFLDHYSTEFFHLEIKRPITSNTAFIQHLQLRTPHLLFGSHPFVERHQSEQSSSIAEKPRAISHPNNRPDKGTI
jgi:hypothetical protein